MAYNGRMKMFAFKNRLFFAFATMTVALVVLFAVLLLRMTASLNRETELTYQQEVFSGNLKQVALILDQANRLAMQVATNSEILSEFIVLNDPDNAQGGGDNYFENQLLDAIRLGSILSGINGVDGFADRISVYNRYGDYVSTGRLYETKTAIAQTLSDVARIDAIIGDVRANPDGVLVVGERPDDWSDNPNTRFVTVYRTLSYNDASLPYGLVGVQIKADRFHALPFWGEPGGDEYFVIDEQRPDAPVALYPPMAEDDVGAVYGALTDLLGDGHETASTPYTRNGTRVILLAARPTLGNWVFVRAMPEWALSAPYQASYIIMVLGCLALTVLLLVVDNFIAERISRPLRRLSASIGGVNYQNMRLNMPRDEETYSTRELAALDESFRSMLSRLDKSIQLEMQAYMRVLQSQMNPHFLYNMLSVIIASSESAHDARTVSMCMKLTAMLRYVAGFARDRVPIRAELEHARNYLELMKERYEDLFSFTIDVDEQAETILIPKLTVQPLAENCFMHGFKNEPPWHVSITARVEGDRWRLSVEDNGVGMTEAEIASLFDRIEVFKRDVAGNYSELSLGGMGLVNTLVRLSLAQEDAISCAITRCGDNGGLLVEIGGERA